MTPCSLATSAFSLVSLPLAVGASLWSGVVRDRSFWIDLDPFEIDLQLTDRNDA